jgi:hypothetical protein
MLAPGTDSHGSRLGDACSLDFAFAAYDGGGQGVPSAQNTPKIKSHRQGIAGGFGGLS